jgi:hypothetical protein
MSTKKTVPFPKGTVVMIGGVLLIIDDYSKDGFWEESSAMYLAFQLVSMNQYTEHDKELGVPGTTFVRDDEWLVELDPVFYKIGEETILITPDPFYVPAAQVHKNMVMAQVVPDVLHRAKKKMIEYALEFSCGLEESDFYVRDSLRDGAGFAIKIAD